MSSITSPGSSKSQRAVQPTARRLSIVIVNWNTSDLLKACLASLVRAGVHEYAEVLVLDNASSDGSAEMVRSEYGWVTLIAARENLGFSRGNNAAIRHASGDYILLLNPDTEVDLGTIDAMLERADQHRDIGVVGVAQRSPGGAMQYEAAIAIPTVWNTFCDLALLSKIFPRSRLFARRTLGWWNHQTDREVPAVAGSALLVRREVLRRIGLLDERMFCCEDIDLCLRARQAGWRVFFVGSHSLLHHGGASTKRSKNAGLQRQIAFQSFWIFLRKHRGPAAGALLSLMVFCWSLAASYGTMVLLLLAGRNEARRADALHYRELVRGLRAWCRTDKLRFRHHLALPPDLEYRTPSLGGQPS